ncbi:MAG: hypothetical protein WC180_07005 [Candidatus Paceibacterota bacterium]
MQSSHPHRTTAQVKTCYSIWHNAKYHGVAGFIPRCYPKPQSHRMQSSHPHRTTAQVKTCYSIWHNAKYHGVAGFIPRCYPKP